MLYRPEPAQEASKGINAINAHSVVRTIARWTAPERGWFAEPASLWTAHSDAAIRLPPGTISATAAYGPSLRIGLTRRPSKFIVEAAPFTRCIQCDRVRSSPRQHVDLHRRINIGVVGVSLLTARCRQNAAAGAAALARSRMLGSQSAAVQATCTFICKQLRERSAGA